MSLNCISRLMQYLGACDKADHYVPSPLLLLNLSAGSGLSPFIRKDTNEAGQVPISSTLLSNKVASRNMKSIFSGTATRK